MPRRAAGSAGDHSSWQNNIRRDRYLTPEEIDSIRVIKEAHEAPVVDYDETTEESPDEEKAESEFIESEFSDQEGEQAEDDELTFDTDYIHERLAESGIENGEVVNPDALEAAPIVQQALADAEAVQER